MRSNIAAWWKLLLISTLEEAADQVLDIVVTDEETPFQDILFEQLAKIVLRVLDPFGLKCENFLVLFPRVELCWELPRV